MEGLGAAASIIAVVELAAKVASLCLEYSSAVKNARADIDRLRQHTASLNITVEGAQKLLQGPHGARLETSHKLRNALNDTHSQLGDIVAKLEEKLRKGHRTKLMRFVGLRALKWPFESKDVDKIVANLQRDQASFSAALQIDQAAEIFDISRKIDLPKLPVVPGAAFDSQTNEHDPKCHPHTRVDLLVEIYRWIEDPSGRCIFWLCGMAGTGKSTISRTVASQLSAQGVPGASFLFNKGDGDRGKAAKFFTTIASQLVHQLPILAPYVRNAIESDPAIVDKNKGEQFQKLILEPLNKCKDNPLMPALVSVVIDALDECDREEDAVAIIRILSKAKEVTSVSLRFFVTSRPELPIRNGFGEIQGEYQDVALHRIQESIVEHDISAFLRHDLARIRNRYHRHAVEDLQLPPDWPSEDVIRILAQMATPLFIFAATVCRFVEDKGRSNPAERLKKVLEYRTENHNSGLDKLDATYLPVLEQITSGRTRQDKTDLLAKFRDVVGPIVLLAQPLSVRSLTRLLNVEAADVYDQLNSLHSVLDIPSQIDAPVRLFHLSFHDFLVDTTKRTTNDFWIDEKKYHKTLADRCIQLLHQHLKRDICGIQVPGKLRSEVDQRTIDDALPPEAQYACQYWVHHLKECKDSVGDGGPVHSFLTRHLLHWLEALSLLGRISESVGMVDDLLALSPADAIQISEFLRDIRRVVLSSRSIIDIAPLQVYASALVFSPARSITRGLFKQEERRWITTGPAVEDDWNACRQTLEGHSRPVWSVAFSPDSKLVVSGSRDNTIKIWDAATGACAQTLEGHSRPVDSSKFIDSWSGDVKTPYEPDYGISLDGRWITRGSEKWLWLPPGCRSRLSAVAASRIAIASDSGRVLIMTFPAANQP
jgi:WD40 repeat protein